MCWGSAEATDSPKPYKRALEKHPCRSGCSPRLAATCLGICHQFLQKMSGSSGLIARCLRKWCHKYRERVRRGSGVGRALQKTESGNPPPSSSLSTGRAVARGVAGLYQPGDSRGSVTLWLVQMMLRNSFWLSTKVQERPGLACFLSQMSSARRASAMRHL